jgi:hypothetical protein
MQINEFYFDPSSLGAGYRFSVGASPGAEILGLHLHPEVNQLHLWMLVDNTKIANATYEFLVYTPSSFVSKLFRVL